MSTEMDGEYVERSGELGVAAKDIREGGELRRNRETKEVELETRLTFRRDPRRGKVEMRVLPSERGRLGGKVQVGEVKNGPSQQRKEGKKEGKMQLAVIKRRAR